MNKSIIEINLLENEIESLRTKLISKQEELLELKEEYSEEDEIPKLMDLVGRYYKYLDTGYIGNEWSIYMYIKNFDKERMQYEVINIDTNPDNRCIYTEQIPFMRMVMMEEKNYMMTEISESRFEIQKELFLNQLN